LRALAICEKAWYTALKQLVFFTAVSGFSPNNEEEAHCMMAAIVDRRRLKEETRELLRTAQVSSRGMTALYLGILVVLSLVNSLTSSIGSGGILSTFVSILTNLMSAVLAAGFVMYCMAIRQGQRAEYLTLFDGFSFVGKVIGLNILIAVFTFLWSLLYLFNMMDTGSMVQNILTALLTMLLANIPTLVLLAIYWAVREKRRKRSELDKMNIDDL